MKKFIVETIGTFRQIHVVEAETEVGASGTTLHVNGDAKFVGLVTANDLYVGGTLNASNFNLNNSVTGVINTGIITTTNLSVGTGSTVLITSGGNIGIGTSVPRAKFDVEGHTRLKTLSFNSESLAISGSLPTTFVEIDLSKAQNFILTLTNNVNHFRVINVPSGVSDFVIKIAQDAIGGRTVDLDNFQPNGGGTQFPIYWPAGGVLPIMTTTASREDIYSYRTYDGGANWYGTVIGQNFAN